MADNEPTPPPGPSTLARQSEPAARARPVQHVELKAALLLAFTVALVVGAVLFLLYSRGFFEPKQTLVLIADDSEGVAPGMDLTFSGFPIGTVRGVALGEGGNVRITVDVVKKDAHWLRTSSVYTLVRGLVGGAQLRAYSGVLTDPPLPDGAERPVLRGDANAEMQRVIGAARDLIDNLAQMTASGSDLQRTVGNVQAFSEKLKSRQGALHAVFGNEEDARKLVAALERANSTLARVDRLVANADRRVFGEAGLADDARTAIREAHGLLSDSRASLQKVDAVLRDAQGITGNVKAATGDLGALRGDVEANLRRIEDMINDLNRKWPFAKEREVQLP